MTGRKFPLFYIATCPCISLLSISFDSDDDAVSTAFLYVIRDKRVYCASECRANQTEKKIFVNIPKLTLHFCIYINFWYFPSAGHYSWHGTLLLWYWCHVNPVFWEKLSVFRESEVDTGRLGRGRCHSPLLTRGMQKVSLPVSGFPGSLSSHYDLKIGTVIQN